MASKKELRALITLAGKIDPSLQNALMKASKHSMKVSNDMKKSSAAMSKSGSLVKDFVIGSLVSRGIEKLSGGLLEAGKNGIKLASDLSEVQNVVDTTFKDSAGQINDWSKTALKSFGLSELQAKQFNGTLGAMLKSSGIAGKDLTKMSEGLTGLAGDFASFYNLNQEDAFEKIRAGISGETEPLKALGINMSVANLQAYALSKGIKTSYDKMDQASQTALRYSYIMNASKDAQGDFAKTQGGFANQQRLFNTTLNQISSTIASKFLPKLTELMQKGNQFLSQVNPEKIANDITYAFNTLGNAFKFAMDNASWLIPIIAGLTATITGLIIIDKINKAYRAFQVVTEGMTIAQAILNSTLLANPFAWVALLIGGLVAGGIALYKNWDTVSAAASKLWTGIKGAFADGVNWVVDRLNGLIKIINKIPGIEIPLIPKVQAGSWVAEDKNVRRGMQLYASGGVASSPSIFGEDGPEMAIPLKRTPRSIGLLNHTAQILGAGSQSSGSQPIYISYAPTYYGGNKEEVSTEFERHKNELREMIKELFDDERRVSFG